MNFTIHSERDFFFMKARFVSCEGNRSFSGEGLSYSKPAGVRDFSLVRGAVSVCIRKCLEVITAA